MSPDNSEARVTVWLSEAMRDEIDDNYINWQDSSRSEWLREAAQTQMLLEDALEVQDVELPADVNDREELIEKVVRAGVVAADLDTED